MEQPMISAHQLYKSFRNDKIEVHTLSVVDLTVARGEMIVIMGPSG